MSRGLALNVKIRFSVLVGTGILMHLLNSWYDMLTAVKCEDSVACRVIQRRGGIQSVEFGFYTASDLLCGYGNNIILFFICKSIGIATLAVVTSS